MKRKATAIIIGLFALVMCIVPILTTSEADAAACSHSWCPVLEEGESVPNDYVAQGDGFYKVQYAVKCRCGEIFFDGDDLKNHQDNSPTLMETCWSWGNTSTGLYYVRSGMTLGVGATRYNVTGYRCEYCGEMR